ncbi:hypothetical protein [Kineococcus gynurae]|uniref:hypothetical protein n=1 Tax=Kineococcus gynurae TaxID=452979 RepID=UPI003D7F0C75
MGRTMIGSVPSGDGSGRRKQRLTRAERRRRVSAAILVDNFATGDDLEDFLFRHGADEMYAAGLPELARWTAFRDQHYRPQDLDQLAHDFLLAQTITDDPYHRAALAEAADVVRRCRENGWELDATVD